MSIDIDWTTLTGGDDRAALAESIRAFIHERFQQVTLPRFVRSVKVHSFDFGTAAPDLELKDVCDPLPDFYEDDEDDEDDAGAEDVEGTNAQGDDRRAVEQQQINEADRNAMAPPPPRGATTATRPYPQHLNMAALASLQNAQGRQSPVAGQASNPGIPGGTSNFSYFHMQPLSAGMMSGHSTPLSAVAPHHLVDQWHSQLQNHVTSPTSGVHPLSLLQQTPSPPPTPTEREPSANDIQTVLHLRYDGDLSMSLTADILLDYPTTSFVSIPLQLNVTGLSFDGIAILAYIRHKAHFCFLSPDDAEALVGGGAADGRSASPTEERSAQDTEATANSPRPPPPPSSSKPWNKSPSTGGLFDSIRVESEIGQRAGGKGSLKNIGKVEAFVLEQVRRLFEAELVYPSFWTFLV